MAYGKGQQREALKRMADLGRAPLTSELSKLRSLCIEACGVLADSVWPASILDDMPKAKDLDAAMLRAQSALKGTLNSVWAEKARLSARSAVTEQVKRAKGNLFGRFKHLSTVGETPLRDGTRRLVNFPEAWSARLSEADVAAMQAVADSMDFRGSLALFRKLEAGKPVSGLTALQQDALRALLGLVKDRFGRPEWKSEESIVQLHLDFRCMPGGREAQDSLLRWLTQAAHQSFSLQVAYATSLPISGVVARSAPIKLSAAVRPDVVQRLIEPVPDGVDARFTSVAVELGPSEVVVKGVLSQQPRPFSLAEAEHLLGNDFGMVNTSAAALVKVDAPLDAEWLASVWEWTKQQARNYLETHWHDGEPVKQFLHQGRKFLGRVGQHARHVDRLRSEIDRSYNRLAVMKTEINRLLGVPADTRIALAKDAPGDARLADLLRRFARLLVSVGHLKMARRRVYRAVDGLKKSWFGWVTTRLAQTCRRYKAAYVRKHLTILAKEKASPDYKGRTFNKMLNNGSKGQFLRRASDKMKWYGVPEIVVPSWHTSSTDVRHSTVDKKQRSGEMFQSSVDGWRMHADLHAGLTIALWPLLRRRTDLAQAA